MPNVSEFIPKQQSHKQTKKADLHMGADVLALYGAQVHMHVRARTQTHTHAHTLNVLIRYFTLCTSVRIKKGAEFPGLLRALFSPAPSVIVQSHKWNNKTL